MILATLLNALWALLFLSWGSFLNVVGYRLLHGVPFLGARSRCPHCSTIIAWYDLVPFVSWVALRGRCRTCAQPISLLYPLIELITLITFWTLTIKVDAHFWYAYGLFFSALIVTIRTDLEAMIIMRWCTLMLIPCALLLSILGLLPLSPLQSIVGALCGFLILWSVRTLYFMRTGEHGMGDGDPELLATIGAFTGPLGCWVALLIGSFLGSIVGIALLLSKGTSARTIPLPFGPFLAIGALLFVLYYDAIITLMQLIPTL